MKEEKICSFTRKGYRLQLLKLVIPDIGTDGIETSLSEIKFQIRENRHIESNFNQYDVALRRFYFLVGSSVLQTKLF